MWLFEKLTGCTCAINTDRDRKSAQAGTGLPAGRHLPENKAGKAVQTTDQYRFLILNGPNLAHIGERQPDIYGQQSLDALPGLVDQLLGPKAAAIRLDFYQSNSEGSLMDRLEKAREEGMHGVVFNAGAYTHTSLAIADCIAWIGVPVVEVHISNVFARQEQIRRQSFMAAHVIGCISGFGIMSYALAVQALYMHMASPDQE